MTKGASASLYALGPPFDQVISELATHAWGSEPAVFILDNVHQMDEMSWKLLVQVDTVLRLQQSQPLQYGSAIRYKMRSHRLTILADLKLFPDLRHYRSSRTQ